MNVLVIDCIMVDIAYCFINNPIVAFLLCQQSVVWALAITPAWDFAPTPRFSNNAEAA